MNCDEFRERVHLMIDVRSVELNDVEMAAHVSGCTACAGFYHSVLAIDSALRQAPVPPIPGSLVHSLREIGTHQAHASPGWKPDIGRAAVYLIPGLLLWSVQGAFPGSARPYILAVMTFIGTFTLMTSILRPRILGSRRV